MAYEKINWKNGTKIADAYVQIGTEKHFVTDAQYTGGTSLDATNLNKMDNAIAEVYNGESWKDANLTSDFTLYSSTSVCKYRKIGSFVQITGQVKTTKTLTSGTIFNLPAGYRPKYEMFFVQQGSSTFKWMCNISPNGNVVAQRYGVTSSIDITTSQWLPFTCMFMVD